MQRIRGKRLVILVGLVGLAGLACNISVGGPTPPASPIAVSTQAAGELMELWKNAIDNSQTGDISLIITEQQITSYVAFKLAAQESPPLSDVQIFLRDGKIQVFGTAKAGSVSTTARITISATVTAEGKAEFSVDEADFGPVPIPGGLLDGLSATLNEAFTGQVGSTATGLQIKSILIADGTLGIIATVKK
jgi:hypothetical protein